MLPTKTPRRGSRQPARCTDCQANPHNRRYVTMWDTNAKRKIAGTAAPCPNELEEYLARHPQMQVYKAQDGGPQAIMMRRKDKSREKDRKKRERKRATTQVSMIEDDSETNAELARKRLDRFLQDDVQGEVPDPAQGDHQDVQQQDQQKYQTEENQTQAQEGLKKQLQQEQQTEARRAELGLGFREENSDLDNCPIGDHQSDSLEPLFDERRGIILVRAESDLDTEEELERNFASAFPGFVNQDSEPHMRSLHSCMTDYRGPIRKGRRQRKPFAVMHPKSHIVLAQRIWTAEAHAAIAEREKEKRKLAAWENREEEEIKEFRELLRRAY